MLDLASFRLCTVIVVKQFMHVQAMTSTLEAVKNFVISQADESNSVPPQQPMRAHCPPPARVAR